MSNRNRGNEYKRLNGPWTLIQTLQVEGMKMKKVGGWQRKKTTQDITRQENDIQMLHQLELKESIFEELSYPVTEQGQTTSKNVGLFKTRKASTLPRRQSRFKSLSEDFHLVDGLLSGLRHQWGEHTG